MEDKIEANMGLVVSVVNSFNPKSDEEREEYIQAGRIGLWKALQKYDPDRGCKFSPYARNPIRWEIIKTINSAKKEIIRKTIVLFFFIIFIISVLIRIFIS